MAAPDESITLPVPETVVAFYLVPVPGLDDPQVDPRALLDAAVGRFDGLLGDLVQAAVAAPHPPLAVRPATSLPDLPMELFAALGAAEPQLARLAGAGRYVTVRAGGPPGWPPLHEWVARALAVVAAERLGSDIVDLVDQRVLDPDEVRPSLPDGRNRIRLADWVSVTYSPRTSGPGYWCTTTGLRRFGLPELQTLGVPAPVVTAWGQAMTGLAARLIATWRATLITNEGAAFVQLPTALTVTTADVTDVYETAIGVRGPRSRPTAGQATVHVRLELDPASDPHGADSFLTLLPPLEFAGPAADFVTGASTDLFGD